MRNIGKSVRRVDAVEKARGETRYLADLVFEGLLYGKFFRSERPRALINGISIPPLPEGYYVVDYRDVPGVNRIALINRDWPAFAEDRVDFIGEIILLLVGPLKEEVLKIHKAIKVDYKDIEPVYNIDDSESIKGGPIYGKDNLYADYHLRKGDPEEVFRNAVRVIEDTTETGFQEQNYMEPQSLVGTYEGGKVVIYGSLQCPFYVRHAMMEVLGFGEDSVRVVQTPTGGGFGGKEDYPEIMGAPLAVAVNKIKKPIQLILDRVEDMSFTSKRHPSKIHFRTALDKDNRIVGLDIDLKLDGGAHESYSCIVLQRAIFTSNGVYNIPNVMVRGRAFATNTVPSGAFRGFGAPQAILGIETHMAHVARALGVPPLELKRKYLIRKGDLTITNGIMRDNVLLDKMIAKIESVSDYSKKYSEYQTVPGKGIGIALYNHGCGFTGDGEQKIIKAKAALKRRDDGKVEILVANTEIGQGLATTYRKVVSEVLEIPLNQLVYEPPDTDKVPDSGPTVASRSMMVVGYLLKGAAEIMKSRWNEPGEILVEKDYVVREGLVWDQQTMQGDAYPAYGWGVAVVEVEVDPVTCEVETKSCYVVHDVGTAIDEQVVEGQVIGGFNQGLGFGSIEKLELKDGLFQQRSMTDYTIPTSMDFPPLKNFLVDNPYPQGPFGAKGLGELVLDGAAAAYLSSVENAQGIQLSEIPVTPEMIMEAVSGDS